MFIHVFAQSMQHVNVQLDLTNILGKGMALKENINDTLRGDSDTIKGL